MVKWLIKKFAVPGLAFAAGNAAVRHLRGQDDLYGEVALITGGSRGLGLLLAREFARCGCRIAICARDAAELDEAREFLAQQGITSIFTIVCDVADTEQIEQMVRAVNQHFGKIDILVNNAAIIQVGPFESLTRRDFEHAMNIIFWGTVDCTLAVLPQMLTRESGRIVNITSIGGKISAPHLTPYSAAKFATVAFSNGLRADLASKGVQVTTIVPGLMRTGSFFRGLFKGDQEGEFKWFSLAASLPLLSMNAEQAARQIVSATRRREAEHILTLPANVIARLYGVLPGLTTQLISLSERLLLPDSTRQTRAARGVTVYNRIQNRLFKTLLLLGKRAARRLNQFASSEQIGSD